MTTIGSHWRIVKILKAVLSQLPKQHFQLREQNFAEAETLRKMEMAFIPPSQREADLCHLLERNAAVELNLSASYRSGCDLRGLARADGIISWLSEASVV